MTGELIKNFLKASSLTFLITQIGSVIPTQFISVFWLYQIIAVSIVWGVLLAVLYYKIQQKKNARLLFWLLCSVPLIPFISYIDWRCSQIGAVCYI